jgi:hypothetical protein
VRNRQALIGIIIRMIAMIRMINRMIGMIEPNQCMAAGGLTGND